VRLTIATNVALAQPLSRTHLPGPCAHVGWPSARPVRPRRLSICITRALTLTGHLHNPCAHVGWGRAPHLCRRRRSMSLPWPTAHLRVSDYYDEGYALPTC